MPALVYYAEAVLGVLLLYLARKIFTNRSRSSYPYPPGPQPWPLVGNIFYMPKVADKWSAFAELGKKYGPLVYFTLFSQNLLVVNERAAAMEMLDRMAYSDRPSAIMGGQLSGYDDTLAYMPYGPCSRATRKLIHRLIGTRELVNKFGARIVEEETCRLMRRMLEDRRPESLRKHVRKTAGGIILRLTYAYVPREDNDPFVDHAERTLEQFSVVSQSGVFLVDAIPWLRYVPRWMPGAGFLRYAEDAKRNIRALSQRPLVYVKEQLAKGSEEVSFISENMEMLSSDEDEFLLRWTAANLYAGGADTSVSALYAAFLALVMYPDVQKKAQEEIDRVIGSDRLPSIEDRDALPYIDAITKEAFRWNPTVPMGIPHRLMEDDVFNGHFVPKGTTVVANIHNMPYDEETYPSPSKFDPDRFMPCGGKEPQLNPYQIAFGFGRRVCPGMLLADATVFMALAMCAAVLDIQKAIDENGAVIEPEHVTVGGTLVHAADFKCSIKARSDRAEAFVADMPFHL